MLLFKGIRKYYMFDDNEDNNTNKSIGVPYELYLKAFKIAIERKEISSPMLQRELHIPYHLSARLMDLLEVNGLIDDQLTPGRRNKVKPNIEATSGV